MKKLEKLSNEVFATLEKSEMNQVLGGTINGASNAYTSEHTTQANGCNKADNVKHWCDASGLGTDWERCPD